MCGDPRGRRSAALWVWVPWTSDSKAWPRRLKEGLPARPLPPAQSPSGQAEAGPGQGSVSGGRNSEWHAQGHGAGELVRPSSWQYQAAEPWCATPSSPALRSSAAPGPCMRPSRRTPSQRARARLPSAHRLLSGEQGPRFRGPAPCLLSPWKPFPWHNQASGSGFGCSLLRTEIPTAKWGYRRWKRRALRCQLISVSWFLWLESFHSMESNRARQWARCWRLEEARDDP